MARIKDIKIAGNTPIIPISRSENKPFKAASPKKRPDVQYTQYTTYDSNGEIISEVTRRAISKNGSGFVISYTDKITDFLCKVPTGSVIRLFFYIAHHQQYGNDGVFGLRCSRKHFSELLGLNRKSVYDSLEWLIANFMVNEIRVDGTLEFMVNPEYVTVGSDKKARLKEWSERWAIYWKRKKAESVVG